MKQPIFLQPVFQERVWGGKALRQQFGYEIPSEQTGECWAISAHPNGQSIVVSEPYVGMTLGELWKKHKGLFGNYHSDIFPLLIKILDANADLSIQVHPNDEYALVHESGELGKTECWYILDCKENAEIVLGHHAQTKEEFQQLIQEGKWEKLLRRLKIRKGDFFYIPSGTIHALCEGTMVLEIQQNSDITYRLYDYDRVDRYGNKRELHLQKAIEVTNVPHQETNVSPKFEQLEGGRVITFFETTYFSVYKWEIKSIARFQKLPLFLLVNVIHGEGHLVIDQGIFPIKKGDHFILPSAIDEIEIQGNLELIVSHP
jgi:mannose-6-phosphate isomerase